MNIEIIKALKERAKEMLADNYNRKIGDEELYTIICELENFYTAYEKEKEKNKNAYRKANNYLYFNDSADYGVALWEVIRTLRPDLAEKWDNGEDAVLEYIEEE